MALPPPPSNVVFLPATPWPSPVKPKCPSENEAATTQRQLLQAAQAAYYAAFDSLINASPVFQAACMAEDAAAVGHELCELHIQLTKLFAAGLVPHYLQDPKYQA